MTDERLELELGAIYARRSAYPAPDSLMARITSIPAVSGPSAERPGERFRHLFSTLSPVAAGGFVVLVAAVVLSQVGVPGPSPDVAAPAASSVSASPPATASPTPSASATPVLTDAATELGTGPALVWERVNPGFELAHPYGRPGPDWFDERFVVVGRDKDAWASSDGLTWVPTDDPRPGYGEHILTFGDRLVRASLTSRILTIEEPDGSTTRREFRGPIDRLIVSPAGIVVVEGLDHEHVIADVLGPEVARSDWRIVDEPRNKDRRNSRRGASGRVWIVEKPDGERERIDLSEHGYGDERNDVGKVATRAWLSPDGVEWTPIGKVESMQTGTEAGFWKRARDGDTLIILHSANGLDWDRVAEVHMSSVVAWRDGALLFERRRIGPERGDREDRISTLTPDGVRELPMSRALRPLGLITRAWVAGPLGLVHVDLDHGRVAFSPDGDDWSVRDGPATWMEPGWWTSGVAVGADAVLVGLQRCSDPAYGVEGCPEELGLETQLWRGTIEG